MIAEHIFLDAPQSIDNRRDLMDYFQTITLGINHFLQAAHLPFNPAQARLLPLVINFDAAVSGFV